MNFSKNKWYNFFYIKEARINLAILFICLCIATFLGALTPKLVSGMSKNYYDDNLFYKNLIWLLLNFLGVYLNRIFYGYSVIKYVQKLIQYVRTEIYSRWLNSNLIDNEKYPEGEILSRIMSDSESVRDLISSGSFGIIIDLCFVISSLIGFIIINKFMGFFISITEIIATIGLIWGSHLMRDMFLKLRNSQGHVNRVTANVMGGFKDSFYTKSENYASKKSEVVFLDFLDKQNTVNTMDATYYAFAESLYPILLALIIFILPFSKIVEVALIFALIDLIQRSINPIKEISGKMANIQRALAGIERMTSFFNDIGIEDNSIKKNISDNLIFKNLSVKINKFEYKIKTHSNSSSTSNSESLFCLKDISFIGKTGELIGVVGLSGSGKSTLLNLLTGNLKGSNNSDFEVNIALENKNNLLELKNIHFEDQVEYKNQVGIVSQDSHIFSDTLQFNLTLDENPSLKFIEFFEFIQNQIPYVKKWNIKPNDLIIPSQLSLGQKQLLAGIRACYLKKNIILFDEIASGLDSELELALRNLIQFIQKFSLTIIVAHRIETIVNAQQILVLKNGRQLGLGIHQDLIKSNIEYQHFINELNNS